MTDEEQFVGEIRMFTGNFAPKGWAFCDGRVYDHKKNQLLFSVLGYNFGEYSKGIPRLPDLRSRVPVSTNRDSRSALTKYEIGEAAGAETASASKNMPGHYQAGSPTQFKAADVKHSIIQPVLAVNFIIALEGVYPQRP